MKRNYEFIWSDGWYIENGKAWFVDGQRDVLCCLDLKTRECEYVVQIPNSKTNKFRLNPRCVKRQNDIYCLPDIGDKIWIYNLDNAYFKNIEIDNPNKDRLIITDLWEFNNKLFIVSVGLKKIIEIDPKLKVIDNYYTICINDNEKIANSVKVEADIFSVSAVSNKVYQFDLELKKVTVHTISEAAGAFHTISYDGCNFWLSGYNKAIYVWNKDKHEIKVITEFPHDFGIYDFVGKKKTILDCENNVYDVPTFLMSRAVGQYVWFVPFQTNQVLYVDKKTHEINVLEISEEIETRESLSNNTMASKYLLQYILDERYLGLFSFKNNCIYEIDSVTRKSMRLRFLFSTNYIDKYLFQQKFLESNMYHRVLFNHLILRKEAGNHEQSERSKTIGKMIYEQC